MVGFSGYFRSRYLMHQLQNKVTIEVDIEKNIDLKKKISCLLLFGANLDFLEVGFNFFFFVLFVWTHFFVCYFFCLPLEPDSWLKFEVVAGNRCTDFISSYHKNHSSRLASDTKTNTRHFDTLWSVSITRKKLISKIKSRCLSLVGEPRLYLFYILSVAMIFIDFTTIFYFYFFFPVIDFPGRRTKL